MTFGLIIGTLCAVLLLAVVSNRLGDRVGIPAPAFFLVGAAVASDVFPKLSPSSIELVQRVVTVALVAILFNGGLDIGWPRFQANAARDRLGRGGRNVRDGGGAGGGGARDVRVRLAARAADRHGAGPDGPGRGVLGARTPGDLGAQRHDPRGGVGRERPGRHRAHGRAADGSGGRWRRRARHARGRGGVRAADGRRRGRRGRRGARDDLGAAHGRCRARASTSSGRSPSSGSSTGRRRGPGLGIPGGVPGGHRRRPTRGRRTSARSSGSTPPRPASARSSRSRRWASR